MKFILFGAFLLVAGAGAFSTLEAEEKGPLNPEQVGKIRSSPEAYDGKTIRVSGRVRSILPGRGKRGSEFLIILIEAPQAKPDEDSEAITVFAYFVPRFKVGSMIIVSGVYHKWGHWAGSEHEHFIEASKITPVETN
ncbi:MAG TPA: hypothetical protein VN944_05105 [Nitrospiria bacterium]|nr:hypothetical protein [Nitrospiria bacterium]